MPFHVMVWPRGAEQQMSGELYALNLSEERLRERFIAPYDEGRPVTWDGRTVQVETIRIAFSERPAPDLPPHADDARHEVVTNSKDVTNDWIHGAPGGAAEVGEQSPIEVGGATAKSAANPRRVMVVHGRNGRARDAMFTFLRAMGLDPIEWEEAVKETGQGSPHNLVAVRAAMEVAQAVVVVLTAEDQAGLLPALAGTTEETALQGQPRQNVTLEAGLAMGVDEDRTILVEMGPLRMASDFAGLNTVRLTNDPKKRAAVKSRLSTAGCVIDEAKQDWMSVDAGGDFEGSVIEWEPRSGPDPAEDAQAASDEERRKREQRAPPRPGSVPREEYHAARRDHLENKINVFLDRHAEIDQPFYALDLVDAIGESRFDESWAKRTLQILEQERRVYQNPDGPGWYATSSSG